MGFYPKSSETLRALSGVLSGLFSEAPSQLSPFCQDKVFCWRAPDLLLTQPLSESSCWGPWRPPEVPLASLLPARPANVKMRNWEGPGWEMATMPLLSFHTTWLHKARPPLPSWLCESRGLPKPTPHGSATREGSLCPWGWGSAMQCLSTYPFILLPAPCKHLPNKDQRKLSVLDKHKL